MRKWIPVDNFAGKTYSMKKTILPLLTILSLAPGMQAAEDNFSWEKANIYFVITDRFCNGNPDNDLNYGRRNDYGSEQLNAATFHGGDFKGMLEKAREGYFTNLGIDVVWMPDVYEQIHGWMSGSGAVNDFPHYGYHGYYPLDYTQIDRNYGTAEEFRELVDTLHSQGIRVMLGANLNNPGYPTLLDAVQYGFADTGLSESEAAAHIRSWSYDRFFDTRGQWDGWYGKEWIRMPDEAWDESNPLEATLYGLPDFKDESDSTVEIPGFLQRKWQREGNANDPWVNPSARRLRDVKGLSPLGHLIGWNASWVEEFGIDGFRCDIVENTRLDRWKELNEACNEALSRWRKKNAGKPGAEWTDNFFMTGDFEPSGIEYKPDYAAAGFSNMVNCNFPKKGDLDAITYTWQSYSDSIEAHPGWWPLSYLNNSYHRDADIDNMTDCATSLLLAPGAVQIFYGDETRRPLSDARFNIDSAQAFRSDMNWATADNALSEHFARLGNIRQSHPAIGKGRQITLDSHTCVRTAGSDTVMIRVLPADGTDINVSPFFSDGETLVELYTGQTATVTNGKITFPHYRNNIAIITRH